MGKIKIPNRRTVMKEKTQSEEFMMNENDEKFFTALQQNLQQDLPEPPKQLDSFIKSAARKRLKEKKTSQNKQFIFWSCGIAAAFAFSFSFLFLSSTQEPVTENGIAISQNTGSSTTNTTQNQVADAPKNLPAQELGWADVMLEIADLSTEINEADMDVSFVTAYSSFYIGK